ncbi:hypothetical protein PsorP6_007884 [Peronosclerospora sorghi]|uniref:Uncharacterized protein n=1 Tax=Peronosclerospora sorghi TaxID=230839 RepID=A0ACC0W7J2_9STRA|nr:hypothetical protein PsorP6_007884 [Peronosclerospora sorghi]
MVHTQSSYRKIIKSFHATVYKSDGFPISLMSATFRFNRLEIQSPDMDIFMIPSFYTERGEYTLSPRTNQVVLQRMTVN